MSSSYEDAIAAITPFDPSMGIAFKYGMSFRDREGELRSLEKATGFRLPEDYRDIVGEYCSGHFDGHYRVSFRQRVEIQLDGFLLMRVADEADQELFEQKLLNPAEQVIEVIGRNQDLFGSPGSLVLFPFGLSAVHDVDREEISLGYLCFDPAQDNRIIFVAGRELRLPFGPRKGELIPSFLARGTRIEVSDSFRGMMLKSSFVFFG